MNVQGRLFRKYALLFTGLLGAILLTSAAVEGYFSYRENKVALGRVQTEKAAAAAAVIRQFVREIENQVAWTTHSAFLSAGDALEQRRIDFLRLLRQSPAITEIALLDNAGKERLRVSRLAMDEVGSGKDFSEAPFFVNARENELYVSPVYFRRQSEPYTTVSLRSAGKSGGTTIADVNLKFIWNEISRIRIGKRGYAYLVDAHGLLIAHPQIDLVLRKTDFSSLRQVAAAISPAPGPGAEVDTVAQNHDGGQVLSAHARVQPVAWTVFVESPIDEAFGPLYDSVIRTAVLALLGLTLAVSASLLLARRMTVPINALRDGATRIGDGDLTSRIEIHTGDELEDLAGQFNDMASRLQASYANLEQKVEERTRELAQSIRELTALGEVSRAVSSTLDLKTVFETVVARAVEFSASEGGALFRYDRDEQYFELADAHGFNAALTELESRLSRDHSDTVLDRVVQSNAPVQFPDLAVAPDFSLAKTLHAHGYRAALVMPLVGPARVIGALVIARRTTGSYSESIVELMGTFASQAVLAIQNARLFRQIEEKGRQLESASQHKSQDPHERHSRLYRTDPRRDLRGNAGKGARRIRTGRAQRPQPVGPDQRCAGSLEDRGR
jgi:HAMP domain-containing protein